MCRQPLILTLEVIDCLIVVRSCTCVLISLDSGSWLGRINLDDDLQGTHGKLQAQPGFPVGQKLITAAPSDTFYQVL